MTPEFYNCIQNYRDAKWCYAFERAMIEGAKLPPLMDDAKYRKIWMEPNND